MTNTFKNSDVNSFKDSDVNTWNTADFYVKTKVQTYWEELYGTATVVSLYLEESYSLMDYLVVSFIEPYTAKLGVYFVEFYGDVTGPVLYMEEYYSATTEPVKRFAQPYDDALVAVGYVVEGYDDGAEPISIMVLPYGNVPVVIKSFELPYRDMAVAVASYVLEWDIASSALVYIEEPYAITDIGVQAVFEEVYSLEVYNKVQAKFDELYYMLTDNTYTSTPSASVVVGGINIGFTDIRIITGISAYCIRGTIDLPSEDEYLKCNDLDTVVCTINGEVYNLFIETKAKGLANAGETYSLELLSETAKLDAPYADTIVDPLVGGIYAEALVVQMAAIGNITVDYQLLNWFLPEHAMSINDETPLGVIRRVVRAVGAVVQTKPNGDMLIMSKYPVSPQYWDVTTPEFVLDYEADIITMAEAAKMGEGYNAFIITDQGGSAKGITLRSEDVDDTTKIIKGFRIPFDAGAFPIETSGGDQVSIDKYLYPVEEQVPELDSGGNPTGDEWEIVEFIDWAGRTTRPIYSIVDWDWIEDDLGTFSMAEDGTLTIVNQDVVSGESLLRIKYMTKFWKWTVTGPINKYVQFFVPE